MFTFARKMEHNDTFFMKQALREAQKAMDANEVPVGAVIVMEGRVIARGYNMVEKLTDVTAHAEMIALTSAFEYMGAKILPDATLYVTVEPCKMCAGAIFWARLQKVVFGAHDEKFGSISAGVDNPFHPKTKICPDILGDECRRIMQEFFAGKRRPKKSLE